MYSKPSNYEDLLYTTQGLRRWKSYIPIYGKPPFMTVEW
ncbi:hypothetical protein MADA3029_320022 [Vibrio nigripulchritudo MADA3029]|nr:hypothetical protein VIBNIAM115_1580008 [Vibrio nigripulchritudo AM115]CCN39807.1 hypothetical protein VIBNIFTn2_1130027 [Vibrio nigripulchritudo FTn2]CCN50026.1 hypothetical protein VIBNIMADA3020_830022 [Vibrio nigripulchritudo MADA3020]CCN56136.1 hypothetical protein VIBNIMADA3021_890028 [Vibrio nigripulchritudo MADA3021]CCN59030.1 hypothetical protein MADA3029_320022 [Vibrio nigripulchritudo MADA3029]CCN67707.1 hypothetical protein VIBNIPon4_850027 [Vibrio nigripulchritudo POn4]CCN77859